MDARTGKKIRLGRLFDQESHKTLIVAYSHGVLMGPRPGMQSLDEMRRVSLSLGRANGLMVAPGLVGPLEEAFIGRQRPSLIVHLDYQSFSRDILPYAEGAAVEMAQIEDVVAAGAEGVMTYLYMGHENPEKEKLEIERNARLARACERWGLILMIEPRSARETRHPEDKTDPRILALYCRVAAEIGADLVKCIHPGSDEALRSVIEGCTVPVLVAGGSRADKAEQAYARAESAMRAGAAGLVYGRNIYEASGPAAELERYLQIVHG
jgi:DhnA family fructose-bisphosphate aldolase class Ia